MHGQTSLPDNLASRLQAFASTSAHLWLGRETFSNEPGTPSYSRGQSRHPGSAVERQAAVYGHPAATARPSQAIYAGWEPVEPVQPGYAHLGYAQAAPGQQPGAVPYLYANHPPARAIAPRQPHPSTRDPRHFVQHAQPLNLAYDSEGYDPSSRAWQKRRYEPELARLDTSLPAPPAHFTDVSFQAAHAPEPDYQSVVAPQSEAQYGVLASGVPSGDFHPRLPMESTTPYAPADSTGIHGTYTQLPNSLYLSQHPAPLPHEAPSAGFDFLPPQPFSSHLAAPVSIPSTSQHPVPSTPSVFVLPAQKVPPSTSRPSSASLSQTNGLPPFAYGAAEPQINNSVAPAGAPVGAPDDAPVASIVAHASIRRAMQNALPTPLTYRPARGSAVHSTKRVDDVPQIGSAETCSRSTSRAAGEPDERKVMPTRCKVNRNLQKEINSLEVTVQCATCPSQRSLARLVLRALPDSLVAALEGGSAPLDVLRIAGSRALPVAPLSADIGGASCWTCMGLQEGDAGVLRAGAQSHRQEAASAPQKSYDATLSAAIDRFEALQLGEEQGDDDKSRTRQAESSGMSGDGYESLLLADEALVSEQYLGENDSLLKCSFRLLSLASGTRLTRAHAGDVCGFLCGIGSISSTLSDAAASAFTVEVICARCDALFRCCSDCGGGGGRLTPGRWRCKELFRELVSLLSTLIELTLLSSAEGRKTCQLSHARNPALGEVTMCVPTCSENSKSVAY